MNNKGISAVVATVLIILITVAAISIIWIAVLPVVKENLESVSATYVDLSILKQGHTVYDEDKKIASVQIQRGSDEENLEKLKVIFYMEGDSEPVVFNDIPLSNSASVYLFNFSNMGWSSPKEVAVAPILRINNELVEGEISHRIDMPSKRLNLGERETGVLEDKGSSSIDGGSGDVECSKGKESFNGLCYISLTGCGDIVDSGRYFLKNDIETDGTCFSILSNDVVLDLNGKVVEGAFSGNGIYIGEFNSSRIFNGEIIKFAEGIKLTKSYSSSFYNLEIKNNSKTGFYLASSKYNRLKNLVFSNNANNGLHVFGNGNNSISDLKFINSTINAIQILATSYNAFNNLSFENPEIGIFIQQADNNLLKDIVMVGQTAGIFMGTISSDDNLIENLKITSGEQGVYFNDFGMPSNNAKNNIFKDVFICQNSDTSFSCGDGQLDSSNSLQGESSLESENCDFISEEDYSVC